MAPIVWRAFGSPSTYIEPFFGSGAVLLGRPGGAHGVETINDIDRFVANFWRAVKADPGAVADAADWPVNECDLLSRHRWLVSSGAERIAALESDPEHFDAVHPLGRWPANVILDEEAAELLDRAVGETRGGEFPANNRAGLGYHGGAKGLTGERVVLDPGGPSRFFFTSKVRPEERNMGLQSTETIIVQSSPWNSETPEEIARLSIDMAQSPPRVTAVSGTRFKDGTAWSTFLFGSETSGLSLLGSTSTIETNGSSTTMSRILSWFLRSTTRECTPRTTAEGLPENGKSSAQTAKSGNPQRLSFGISRAAASGPTDTANPVGFAEWLRESKSVDLVFEGAGNRHATLKPLDLCEYLARLILPPKRPDAPRRLLVPFSGAGSEICGALEAGWEDVVGIEMEEQSAEWARARIAALLSTNPAERKGRRDDAGQVLQRGLFE